MRVAIAEDSVLLRFDQPQRQVAAGQSVVFYEGDQVLGGGVVSR
jgi:tRNA-uridine 2-sulfurtransferase